MIFFIVKLGAQWILLIWALISLIASQGQQSYHSHPSIPEKCIELFLWKFLPQIFTILLCQNSKYSDVGFHGPVHYFLNVPHCSLVVLLFALQPSNNYIHAIYVSVKFLLSTFKINFGEVFSFSEYFHLMNVMYLCYCHIALRILNFSDFEALLKSMAITEPFLNCLEIFGILNESVRSWLYISLNGQVVSFTVTQSCCSVPLGNFQVCVSILCVYKY